MANRLNLHEELCSLLGSRNVYFQPPESVKMRFPAIVYELTSRDKEHADNHMYRSMKAYTVTVIDNDPDGLIPDRILNMNYAKFDRRFKSDGMYHDVFTIYY